MNPAAWRKQQQKTLAEVARLLDAAMRAAAPGTEPAGDLALSSVQRYERGEREAPTSVALAYERISDKVVLTEDLAKARRQYLRTTTATR